MKEIISMCQLWRGTTAALGLVFLLAGCGGGENGNTQDAATHGGQHAEGQPCVVVSTTDLQALVEAIAGDIVELHCFGKGNQDPHALDILPSYVREMNDADLWIQVGNDIEAAWYPALMANVKNTKIVDGADGFLDISGGVLELEGAVGNALGVGHTSGLHTSGKPHYLLDPIEGIRAAKSIADRLASIVPAKAEEIQQNYEQFRRKLADALIGSELAQKHDVVEIGDLFLNGKLEAFLAEQGHGVELGGWLGQTARHRDTVVVGDHDLWPYFCRRVGLSVLGYFEPEPGVSPTTKHLGILIDEMKSKSVPVILSAPYFDARHGRFVSDNTGAKVLPMCHQAKARPGTDTYFDMVRHNMETIITALDAE